MIMMKRDLLPNKNIGMWHKKESLTFVWLISLDPTKKKKKKKQTNKQTKQTNKQTKFNKHPYSKIKTFPKPHFYGNQISQDYCGAKGSRNPGPFHIKPKAHAEEEEMPEDE